MWWKEHGGEARQARDMVTDVRPRPPQIKTSPPPPAFKHYVKLGVDSQLLFDLFTMFPCDDDVPSSMVWWPGGVWTRPATGPASFGSVDSWVSNQEKQGYVHLWFRTRQDFQGAVAEVERLREAKAVAIKHRLYKYCARGQGWVQVSEYVPRRTSDFVGYHRVLTKIKAELANYTRHAEFLRSVGESKSLNYLLYGPPGTGKTSLILTLASELDLPVYVVGAAARGSVALTPPGSEHGLRVLLYEDFDRYVADETKTGEATRGMSELLNSLDGVDSGTGIVRFFTGNDCAVVFSNRALVNRMSACFRFDLPDRAMFAAKLDRLLTGRPTAESDESDESDERERAAREALLDRAVEARVSLRPFVNFVVRYLFEARCLSRMLENVDELVVA